MTTLYSVLKVFTLVIAGVTIGVAAAMDAPTDPRLKIAEIEALGAVITAVCSVAVGIISLWKLTVIHVQINSRMDQMVKLAERAARGEGNIEGREASGATETIRRGVEAADKKSP